MLQNVKAISYDVFAFLGSIYLLELHLQYCLFLYQSIFSVVSRGYDCQIYL